MPIRYGTPETVVLGPFVCPVIRDASGHGFDGNLNSSPTPTLIDGFVGGDKAANASIAYADAGAPQIIPNNGVAGPTFQNSTQPGYDSSHTIEIWAKIPSSGTTSADRVVFQNEHSSGGGTPWERVLVELDGRIDWYWLGFSTGPSNHMIAPAGSFPNDGNPHHLVCVFDYVLHTTTTNIVRIYVDGVQVFQLLTAFATSQVISWWRIWAGGASIRSTDPVYFDEFALYDHPLSAARVAAHYAARSNFVVYTAAVLADLPSVFWHFNCT